MGEMMEYPITLKDLLELTTILNDAQIKEICDSIKKCDSQEWIDEAIRRFHGRLKNLFGDLKIEFAEPTKERKVRPIW